MDEETLRKLKDKYNNKHCKIEKRNGFVLDGKVTSMTITGFFLQSDQCAGYFNWTAIDTIVEF